jgi:perosamine synthetase
MSEMIPLSVPRISGNEWLYVKDCLDTAWVSSAGQFVERFEKECCAVTGARFGVACVNGTAALQTALKIAGVEAGDEVIVPTLTFIATVNAVHYLGAEPVFMDCDDYYNLDVLKTMEFLSQEAQFRQGATYNRRTGKKIAALLPVHVFGNAVPLDPLLDFCRERQIRIVEDATESLGTVYRRGPLAGKRAGAVGDLGCLSFNGNKIITTGGGGMLLTDNQDYAETARYLTTQAKDDEIRYIHHEIGYNFRLNNIQAALGVAQLEQLPEFLEIKRVNYRRYKQEIDRVSGLHLAEVPDYADNNCWMVALQIDQAVYGKDREETMALLTRQGIQTRPVWYLNHWQKPYHHCQTYRIEKAPALWEQTLNLPCSIGLTSSDLGRVIEGLKNA